MFRRQSYNEAQARIDALDRSMGVIEFGLDGIILTANKNFLDVVGYRLDEIQGRHHRIFIEEQVAKGQDYAEFWRKLQSGEFLSGEFMRLDKAGRRVWLEASYNPVLGSDGKPIKVVKYAADITSKKNEVSRLLTMIDGMPVAVMTADPKNDFKINYLNETSRRTLGSIEQYLPIKVSEMLGRSFDVFHKNPHHQRNMLADASRLPHRTKIRLGPETLDLQVSAIKDPEGNYVGPMLTWSLVTAQVAMASEVSHVVEALGSAISEMQRSAEGLNASAEDASARDLGRGRLGGDDEHHPRDLGPGGARVGARAADRQPGGDDGRDRAPARGERRQGRLGGEHDQVDRRPDEPARPERHDRGGPRRRGRQGLCGGGHGSEGARRPDRQGDRRDPRIRSAPSRAPRAMRSGRSR